LDEWIVMPDHVHGIIRIDPYRAPVETPYYGVSTHAFRDRCIAIINRPRAWRPKWKSENLGAIISQFKQQSTKRIRSIGYADFAWQPRFHESVIRDENALNVVRQYIRNNPTHLHADSSDDFAIHKIPGTAVF